MVANKYAFLQITRRRFLNEWEAFKKVISRRNIRRRITIPQTLSNLKLLRRITRTENILRSEERFSRNAETDVVCRLVLEKKDYDRDARAFVQLKRPRGRHAVTCLYAFLTDDTAATYIYTLSLHDALPI